MRYYCLFLLLLGLFSCDDGSADKPADPPTATSIITRAVDVHYGDYYANADISFTFRAKDYSIRKQGGDYTYTRSFGDTLDQVSNDGFVRKVAGEPIELTEKKATAYTNSVNSVRYFFMLPYGLEDPAVRAELLGETTIKGQAYHNIQVTFTEEGGGEDHEDVYHYYFNQATGELDYLAYRFFVDGGGIRFREAINKREIGGLLIQDYVNYKPKSKAAEIEEAADLFEKNQLLELSKILNEAVKVN